MPEYADNNLIHVLNTHRETMTQVFLYRASHPSVHSSDVLSMYNDVIEKVVAALKVHSVFKSSWNMLFLSRQIVLSPEIQAQNIIDYAVKHGGAAAVDWYRKVWDTRVADIDVITEVHGLIVQEAITFSNGVRLIPYAQLGDSPQARILAAQSSPFTSTFNMLLPSAAVLSLKNVLAETDGDHSLSHKYFLEKIEFIRRTITALTLADAHTPITGVSWIDFCDLDLNASGTGYSWQGATYDGRQPDYPVEITAEALAWVERFLALKGPIASKCSIALTRLNLARRRRTPGDKAIDGCIALEALLADGQPGDLTYKLKIRAARLLGKTYVQRQRISSIVGRFYSLRGKVVHGQSEGSSKSDHETAQYGLELTLSTLQKIVMDACLPDSSELELGPLDSSPS